MKNLQELVSELIIVLLINLHSTESGMRLLTIGGILHQNDK